MEEHFLVKIVDLMEKIECFFGLMSLHCQQLTKIA